MDVLDAAVWQALTTVLSEPERIAEEYRRRLETPSNLEREPLEAQLRKVRQSLGRVIDSYAEGIIEKAEFEPRLGRLRQRAAALAAQLDQIEAAAVQEQELRRIVGRLEEFAQQVQRGLEAADLTTKRAILQSVVKRVEVGRDEVTVVFRVAAGPFELRPSVGEPDCAHYGERILDPGV